MTLPKNQFAPVANLGTYRRLSPEALGDYHLLIATEVVKDPEGWGEFWLGQDDKFIIMDNGLIETGSSADPGIIKAACEAVEPDCVVLPDTLGDAAATFEASLGALSSYRKLQLPIMGVVQGRTIPEVENLLAFYKDSDLEFVSIPRVMSRIFGTRRHLVERARWHGFPIHLLGWSENVEDDLTCASMESVMGIDSAVPLWYRGQFPDLMPRDARWGDRPEDYWERDLTAEGLLIAEHNINWARTWIRLSKVKGA